MNHVILSGRLTRNPELVHSGERAICRMRVAVDNGKYDTTYIDVASFDRQAYACAEHLSKGRKVGVSGRLAYSEWRDEDGNRRERYNIVGRVEFLDRPPAQRDPEPAEQPPSPAPKPRLAAVPEPEPQREAEPNPALPQLALAV
jgi:single-strand DNA-binding protein